MRAPLSTKDQWNLKRRSRTIFPRRFEENSRSFLRRWKMLIWHRVFQINYDCMTSTTNSNSASNDVIAEERRSNRQQQQQLIESNDRKVRGGEEKDFFLIWQKILHRVCWILHIHDERRKLLCGGICIVNMLRNSRWCLRRERKKTTWVDVKSTRFLFVRHDIWSILDLIPKAKLILLDLFPFHFDVPPLLSSIISLVMSNSYSTSRSLLIW